MEIRHSHDSFSNQLHFESAFQQLTKLIFDQNVTHIRGFKFATSTYRLYFEGAKINDIRTKSA